MLLSVATVLFFFSSRRRHTRLTCDWSSDVCSSDLGPAPTIRTRGRFDMRAYRNEFRISMAPAAARSRSEERRVGKEGGDRGGWAHERKKEPLAGEAGG